MLKNAATAEMSQMSRSENPARRKGLAIGVRDGPWLRGELYREVEHRPVPFAQAPHAVIRHHPFTEDRIAGELAHGGAVCHEAIVAAVLRRRGDRNHPHARAC